MIHTTGKRLALVKTPLTKRTIDALEPTDKAWIAWDDRLTGFGVRVYPSGHKSFIVNYRTGDGGRKAPNKRIVLGRCDRLAPERARRMAHQVLGKVASGDDPADERAEARGIPVLRKAFEEYIAANPNRTMRTDKGYRELVELHLRDWLSRPLDAITRRDVEARFNHLTAYHGWSQANATIALLRWIYRRPCVDLEGLRNPVDLWLAAGGKFHHRRRRKISSPAEVLPLWRAGIQAVVVSPVARDAFWFGFHHGHAPQRGGWRCAGSEWTGRRRSSGSRLPRPACRWNCPSPGNCPPFLERRWEESGAPAGGLGVFPSSASGSGRLSDLAQHYKGIGEACGTRFWYHGLRNAFITVAERDLMLPASLTKRLVKPRPAQRRHRRVRRRLDHRATARASPTHRRPHPAIDEGG